MTTTPYLKLQKPPFDDTPWDDAVNGNMDIIDAFIANYMSVPNYVGVWQNSTNYIAGQNVLDVSTALIYTCQVTHTSAASPTTFPQDRVANPTYWVNTLVGSFPASTYASKSYVDEQDAASFNNIGRNKLHNPLFNIWQRGVGPFSGASVYTADRWLMQTNLDTSSISQGVFNDAGRAVIGDEEAALYFFNSFTGNAGAAAFNVLQQRMEGSRRLGNKTVTISFWANCSVGALKLGINIQQNFGTGGSPSAAVRALATGNSVTLTTTIARYTTTIAIPSVSGKTFGSSNDGYTALEFWFSSGANSNASAGNIGVQSGGIALWGVQLEVGTVSTQLSKPDQRFDLSNCERFFQAACPAHAIITAAGALNYLAANVGFRTTMRAVPTMTGPTNLGAPVNLSASITADGRTAQGFRAIAQSSIAGLASFDVSFDASADL